MHLNFAQVCGDDCDDSNNDVAIVAALARAKAAAKPKPKPKPVFAPGDIPKPQERTAVQHRMVALVMRTARTLKAVVDKDTDGVDESDTAHPRVESMLRNSFVTLVSSKAVSRAFGVHASVVRSDWKATANMFWCLQLSMLNFLVKLFEACDGKPYYFI